MRNKENKYKINVELNGKLIFIIDDNLRKKKIN
jgi:hypothetical protein